MKKVFVSALLLAGTYAANAATYSTTFEGPPYPAVGTDADLNGLDGWSVSDTSTGFLSFVTEVVEPIGGSTNYGGVGGLFDAPSSPVVSVSHGYTAQLGNITYNLRVSLLDSTNSFPNRDSFGITLLSGGSNLFSINLTPTVTDPATPEASSSDGVWDMSYTAGGNTVTLNQALIEGGLYDLALTFSPSGANQTSFVLGTTGDATLTRNGSFAVNPATLVGGIGFEHRVTGAADPFNNSGDNALLFDNINVVPEPSSVLLVGLAGFGFAFRRVRG